MTKAQEIKLIADSIEKVVDHEYWMMKQGKVKHDIDSLSYINSAKFLVEGYDTIHFTKKEFDNVPNGDVFEVIHMLVNMWFDIHGVEEIGKDECDECHEDSYMNEYSSDELFNMMY